MLGPPGDMGPSGLEGEQVRLLALIVHIKKMGILLSLSSNYFVLLSLGSTRSSWTRGANGEKRGSGQVINIILQLDLNIIVL